MCPEFLHLEDDAHRSIDINCIRDELGVIHSGENVLDILRDFYVDLYQCWVKKSDEEIDLFLQGIDFPKLHNPIINEDITEGEIVKAIMRLKPGKSPGSDGITAAFY